MLNHHHMTVGLMLLMLLLGSTQAFDQFYPFETATGKMKTPAENLGAPWFQDNRGPVFGTDKDFTLKYDSVTNRLTLTGAGPFYVGVPVAVSKNATTTVSTTFTNGTLKNFIPVDASGGTKIVTLPAANSTGVTGVPVVIATAADPGSNYISIRVTGGGKIGGSGGSTWLNTTDAKAGVTLISDGTNYEIAGAYGTWS